MDGFGNHGAGKNNVRGSRKGVEASFESKAMTPELLRLAAEHLRITAQCLFESCTVNDQWDGEHPDEKSDCEEMQTLADELDAHAVHEEEIWCMATAPQKPRTRAEQERAASMFATLSANLAKEAASMPADPPHGETACLPNSTINSAGHTRIDSEGPMNQEAKP